jgi:hypothetical protein
LLVNSRADDCLLRCAVSFWTSTVWSPFIQTLVPSGCLHYLVVSALIFFFYVSFRKSYFRLCNDAISTAQITICEMRLSWSISGCFKADGRSLCKDTISEFDWREGKSWKMYVYVTVLAPYLGLTVRWCNWRQSRGFSVRLRAHVPDWDSPCGDSAPSHFRAQKLFHFHVNNQIFFSGINQN